MGAQIPLFVLMGVIIFAFVLFTSVGSAWLTVRVMNGKRITVENANAAGSPDFLLQPPQGRYRFKWDPTKQVRFDIKLDTERNPDITNNPAFILHNKTNTIGYNIAAVWKSETSGVEDLIKMSPKFADIKFDLRDTQILIFCPAGLNFSQFFVLFG
jgi:hypothetical protein